MKTAWMPLPNGPEEQVPTRIVIHCMGEFIDTDGVDYYAVEWLRKLGISAHVFVPPSGILIRSREDTQGAWHAKAKGYNYHSLGMEWLVPGLYNIGTLNEAIKTPYLNDIQYALGVAQVQEWLDKWRIEEITRHSVVDPANKQDPGAGFPWVQFLADIGWEGS